MTLHLFICYCCQSYKWTVSERAQEQQLRKAALEHLKESVSCRQCFLWTALGRGRGTARGLFFFPSKRQFSYDSPLKGKEWKLRMTRTWPSFIVCGMIGYFLSDLLIVLKISSGLRGPYGKPLYRASQEEWRPLPGLRHLIYYFFHSQKTSMTGVFFLLWMSSALCYGKKAKVDWAVALTLFPAQIIVNVQRCGAIPFPAVFKELL